ncbi:MAG TPA: efflux transporter outer membrane subunit [Bryobacteraceae bacterium]|nr:efflux transporter outer membrane subunit [Bryobacteraceae bacterium]
MDLAGERLMRVLVVVGLALGTSACLVGPNYVKPSAPAPPSFKEPLPDAFKEAPGWTRGTPLDDMHRGKWWEIFNDPTLNSLEEQINVNNQTLAAAEASYRGAQAAIRVARASFYPTLSGGVSALGTGTSGNIAISRGAQQYALLTAPSAGATWAPDLFGGIRRSVEANTALAQASAGDLENTRLLLESELASDYFILRGLDTEKRLLDDTVVAYQHALDLTVNRFKQGVASQVDVAQAQTQLAQTQAQATDTLVQRQQAEHAIAILIGKPPSELSIPVAIERAVPPPIPGVIPSELLQRRPDIAANERRVAAANAQIGVAIAAFYPTLSLSASGGLESSSLLSLFTWPSRFWSLGPSFSELFYDAGRRRGITEEAQAAYDSAVANYRQSVLTAFQNVEDDLTALKVLEGEAAQQAEAVEYANRSLELANAQYQGGITTYLQVISAQEIALSNQVTSVQLQTRRLTAAVALIQALGGGWDVSELPTPKEVTPQKAQKVASVTK